MKRMALAGVLFAVVVAGCGADETGSAPPTEVASKSESASVSAQQTSSVATAVEPASPTPAPPVESAAAPTPAEVIPTMPDAGVPASDRPSGEQLYLETCQEFVTAIDALAATGVTSREQAAAGIAGQLQANPSWSTVPTEDQQQMLRGLDAAGRGSC